MNPDIINFTEATGAIEGAFFFGWAVGIILWIIRFLLIDLPRTGNIFRKGGDITL
jgi:hypothetical protein